MRTGVSRWILAAALLALPVVVSAEETHTYEFRDGGINATWEGIGPLAMQKSPTGIILSTQADTGALVTDMEPSFLADAGMVVLTAERPGMLHFVWVYKNDPTHKTHAVPMNVDSGEAQDTYFSLAHVQNWYAGTKRIGIVLPPYTTVLVHRLGLMDWNLAEKAWAGLTSFWIMDHERPYGINFLWGPQLELIPTEHPVIYDSLPPRSLSATLVFNILLLVAIVTMFGAQYFLKKPLKKAILWSLLACGGAWIFFDIRMGLELLAWIREDGTMYVTAPEATRTFRDRGRFYDFAEFAKPLVSDRRTYVFFAQAPWPYLGNIRYVTYPSIPGDAIDSDDTWVVFDRPDLHVTNDRIMMGDKPISLPGKILGQFDTNSFVFRTLLPPAEPVNP